MEYVILKSYQQVAGYVKEVTSVADKNKGAFGFLSNVVYEQMASKGQLWIATNASNELKGYLMFGGTMPTLKVIQIYASKSVKGHGVGRKLIDALKIHAENGHYHTISARVASDLAANKFWERVGFSIYGQVNGGKTTSRIINIRGHSLKRNDLFGGIKSEGNHLKPSGPILDRPVYVLDLVLLLDVVKARQGCEKVIRLMQIGFQGKFSICVTPEFKKELERHTGQHTNDTVLRLAGVFPELKAEGDISGIADLLRQVVFPDRQLNRKSVQNDESDLLHLAYCVSAGVRGFITREKALLRACGEIKDRYGVSIITPEELVLDENDPLISSNLWSADFSINTATDPSELRGFLTEFAAPPLIIDKIFAASPVEDNEIVWEARLDGSLFGVYFFQKPLISTSRATACLYVVESSPKAIAAIDHFLELALRYQSGFTYRLDFYIGMGQPFTEETLARKGFIKSDNHFVKIKCNHFLTRKNWGRFAKDVKSLCGFTIPQKLPTKKQLTNTGICFSDSKGGMEVLPWFDFETMISPKFVVNTDRSCVLVPIREQYANGLIRNISNQLSLLSTHDKILLLEKAYFRSSNRASLFCKGGVIAFYVSGRNSIQEIVGFARVTYSDVIDIDNAIVKLDRQGVLSRDELSELTDKLGKLHVFTFDNFLEFDRRISFRNAKNLGLISNANLVAPEKIGLEKLEILIGEAFDE